MAILLGPWTGPSSGGSSFILAGNGRAYAILTGRAGGLTPILSSLRRMPISILVVKFDGSIDQFLQRFSCEVGIAAHRRLQSLLAVLNNLDLGSDPSSHLALKLFLSESFGESFLGMQR